MGGLGRGGRTSGLTSGEGSFEDGFGVDTGLWVAWTASRRFAESFMDMDASQPVGFGTRTESLSLGIRDKTLDFDRFRIYQRTVYCG